MAHVISSFGILPNISHKTQILSCMKEYPELSKNKIYNSECIQKRIMKAAKMRVRLDYEIKKKYENIKHINCLG